jgi:colicin import membrane protein
MRNLIIGVSLLALAGTAVAQVTPAPDAAAVVPTPVDAAAAQRAADAEKAAAKDRAAAEERMNDQAAQAEKDRAAAEKSAKEQEKAAAKQQAAADKAAAERAAADKAAAEKAAAASAAATAAAAAPTGDARDVATQVCLAEAKSRATAVGATNVTMNEVKDTDKKSDGRASVTAKVNVITTDSKGKIKAQKKTIKCETRNGVVTKFKWD